MATSKKPVASARPASWQQQHESATGHSEFRTSTVPYPHGHPSDPDTVDVVTCTVCLVSEPYGRSE